MGRRKQPGSVALFFRISGPTARQLRSEAKAKGWPLAKYIRQLLETYAPAVEQENADKLSEATERLRKL